MKIECVYEKEYCCDDMKNLIIDHENVMNYKDKKIEFIFTDKKQKDIYHYNKQVWYLLLKKDNKKSDRCYLTMTINYCPFCGEKVEFIKEV